MIYVIRSRDAALDQGDLFESCPLIYWVTDRHRDGRLDAHSASSNERVIVLTQACDLSNAKTSKVQVAIVHATARLVADL